MKWPPWDPTRGPSERQQADAQVKYALDSLSAILHDLRSTLDRIEDKRHRGFPGDDGFTHHDR